MGHEFPYPDETWEQFADAQLDHNGTPAQHAVRDARRSVEALAACREVITTEERK